MPDTTLLPISPVPPFSLVVHRSHVVRFTRHPALAEVFGNSPLTGYWPENPQPVGRCRSLFHAISLQLPVLQNFSLYQLATPSCGTDNAKLSSQQFILCFKTVKRPASRLSATVKDEKKV